MKSCRRCNRNTAADELDDCVRCRSKDLCIDCMATHDCNIRAAMNDALTIHEETRP